MLSTLASAWMKHALKLKGHITHESYVDLKETNHDRYIELLAYKECKIK